MADRLSGEGGKLVTFQTLDVEATSVGVGAGLRPRSRTQVVNWLELQGLNIVDWHEPAASSL